MPVTGPALTRRWAPTRSKIPAGPAWPTLSIDVSNYQRELTEVWFERWTSAGYSGLIVQAVVGLDGRSYTAPQCQAALDHGWSLAAYVWCSSGDAMSDWRFRQRAALLEPFIGRLHFLALDVEEAGLQPEDVDADLEHCDALKDGAPVYTGRWAFEQNGWLNESYWSGRRLWDSRYTGIPDVDAGWIPYGGWHEAWMTQFTDEPLDLNVARVP